MIKLIFKNKEQEVIVGLQGNTPVSFLKFRIESNSDFTMAAATRWLHRSGMDVVCDGGRVVVSPRDLDLLFSLPSPGLDQVHNIFSLRKSKGSTDSIQIHDVSAIYIPQDGTGNIITVPVVIVVEHYPVPSETIVRRVTSNPSVIRLPKTLDSNSNHTRNL